MENLVEWMAGETLSTTNPTWPDPGLNPGRRGGKPAINRFSYGAAKDRQKVENQTKAERTPRKLATATQPQLPSHVTCVQARLMTLLGKSSNSECYTPSSGSKKKVAASFETLVYLSTKLHGVTPQKTILTLQLPACHHYHHYCCYATVGVLTWLYARQWEN
jgi:hypothetical protein